MGKISGVYKKTMMNMAEIAHLATMLNVILIGTSDTPSPMDIKHKSDVYTKPNSFTKMSYSFLHSHFAVSGESVLTEG